VWWSAQVLRPHDVHELLRLLDALTVYLQARPAVQGVRALHAHQRVVQAAGYPAASPALPHLALPRLPGGRTERVPSPPARRPHATLLAADLLAAPAVARRAPAASSHPA